MSSFRAAAFSLLVTTPLSAIAEEKIAFPIYGKIGGCSSDRHHVVLNLQSSFITVAKDFVQKTTLNSILTADFFFERTLENMSTKDIDNGALVESDFINATLPAIRNTLLEELKKADPEIEVGLLLSLRGAEYRFDSLKCP